MTSQTIRARYANGVITPLEPLDLPEGCEVTVNVPVSAAAVDAPAPALTSPAYLRKPRILEIIEEIHRDYPPDEWGEHPADYVRNKKHYLYGHAKEEG